MTVVKDKDIDIWQLRDAKLREECRGGLILPRQLNGWEKVVNIIVEHLKRIAGKIMNEEQEFEVYEFLGNGRIDLAKEYLLGRVDSCYCRGSIDFPTAAMYYSMIDPTPERARMFPQRTAPGC